MREKMKEGDVLGRCPNCGSEVAVYARGGVLRVRVHTTTRNHGTGWYHATCPVTGVDGADALDRVMRSQEQGVVNADRDVTAAEGALTKTKARAAKARAQRDEYAAKVADLKARVAGKGGV